MFGFFKKKNPISELKKKAVQLEEEAFQLSRSDRKAADQKTAESHELWEQIRILEQGPDNHDHQD